MKINSNLSEIRAEVLLNHLYPEMEERWKVHHEGAFFRNYNGDSMSIDETTGEVRLSRDGFMRLLPHTASECSTKRSFRSTHTLSRRSSP